MRLRGRTKLALGAVLVLAACALTASAGVATGRADSAASSVPRAGTGSPQTGAFTPSGTNDATDVEFAGGAEEESGPNPFAGSISLSTGVGHSNSVNSSVNAKSNPQFNFGF